ncbi:MAG: transposase [Sphingomonadales bacterium]
MDEHSKTRDLSNVIRIDDERIQDHLGKVVRNTVEETLNALLDAEADALAGAGRYERAEGRRDYRAGRRKRQLHTKAGEVTLKAPKLRKQAFETAIIERYRRREASVEEALMEMYLAGVSVRRVEDITEALWGTRVSAGTVSNLNKKIYAKIEAWRLWPIRRSSRPAFWNFPSRNWPGGDADRPRPCLSGSPAVQGRDSRTDQRGGFPWPRRQSATARPGWPRSSGKNPSPPAPGSRSPRAKRASFIST